MMEKKKLFGTILGVFLFVVLIFGVTYAIYTWATTPNDEKLVEGNIECFNIVYTKGEDIGSDNSIEKIQIGSTYTDGESTTIKIKLDGSCNVPSGVATLYLNTTEMSNVLKSNNILNYQVLDGNTSKNSGVISDVGSIPIYDNFTVTTSEKSITVYLWINGEHIDNSNVNDILSSIYKGNITAKVESR